jgi:hypothetical protein
MTSLPASISKSTSNILNSVIGPGEFVRAKAWKNLGRRVVLNNSGGHEVRFEGRRTYPFKFLQKHYPVRSQEHGEKKVFRERKARWLPQERSIGWHTHYDHINKGHSFIRRPEDLRLFNASALEPMIVKNEPTMVDWTAAHIKALRPELDKVLMLVDLELKKKEESLHSVAVEVRKRKPARNGDRALMRSEVEKKRLAFNQFTTELAERDKNIRTLCNQIAKQQNTVDSLTTELTETHEILLRLVDQLADRHPPGSLTPRKRNTSVARLSVRYRKLRNALGEPFSRFRERISTKMKSFTT